jgi:hypothetical protein
MIKSKVKAGAIGGGLGGGLAGILVGIIVAILQSQGIDLSPEWIEVITTIVTIILGALGSFVGGYFKVERVG